MYMQYFYICSIFLYIHIVFLYIHVVFLYINVVSVYTHTVFIYIGFYINMCSVLYIYINTTYIEMYSIYIEIYTAYKYINDRISVWISAGSRNNPRLVAEVKRAAWVLSPCQTGNPWTEAPKRRPRSGGPRAEAAKRGRRNRWTGPTRGDHQPAGFTWLYHGFALVQFLHTHIYIQTHICNIWHIEYIKCTQGEKCKEKGAIKLSKIGGFAIKLSPKGVAIKQSENRCLGN